MKHSFKATLVVLLAIVAVQSRAQAADESTSTKSNSGLMKDFDTLGGNDVLLDKARELNPESTVSIVQDRIVDRRKRFEIAPEFTSVLGGDAYNKTNTLAINAYFHITPRWALGAKYSYDMNQLRPEGQNLIDQAVASGSNTIPEIDFPKSEALALVNWFPIYGKMNLYDLGVAHFDIYAVGGAGQVSLKSGSTMTYTAGGGVGFWFSQHLSTRAELRFQTYNAQRSTGETRMNLTVASIQIGYLL